MTNKRYIVALELSGSQIKGAAASVSANTHSSLAIPAVEALAIEDKVNCVQYGRVQNFIDAAEHVNYVLQKLENDSALANGKITSAYVALAGRSLGSVRTSAELSLHSEMEITDDILKRLRQEATKSIPNDKKVLKVLPRKYYIDNQASQNPVGTMGSKLKGDFTVVTCSSNNRKMLEKVFVERVDLPIKGYIVTPLALAELVLGGEEMQLGCALVDIGAQTTTIAIYKDRALQYIATLPLGSHNITRDIAAGMNITEERAEQIKISQGNAVPDTPSTSDEQSRINLYVQARAGELVANIGAQIGYADFKPSDLGAGIILTGRGSKLRNLDKLIENQLKVRTRQASITATVNVVKRTFDPTDYLPLISIISHSAKSGDQESCMEFEAAQTEEAPVQEVVMAETAAATGHSYDAYDSDDPYWNLDDDQAAKRRDQELRERQRRQQKEEEKRQRDLADQTKKEEDKAKKEEERQRKKEEKERRDQEREEKRRNAPSLLNRLRDTVTRLVTYQGEGDADLDDE